MEFSVKPKITARAILPAFFADYRVGPRDLIITNEYLIAPYVDVASLPCDALYQEQYGRGEPSDEMIDAMLAACDGKEYERVIAIGGGTVIDISKLFVFGGGLDCAAIFAGGAGLPRRRRLVIIPTTCGTGSEVTGISIVEFKKKNTKLGLAVPALYADEAVLIPALLAFLPWEVFATSSIDALIHAVESYVSPKATAFSRVMGKAAIEAILAGYRAIAATGERTLPVDMTAFLTASTMAGIAFSNAGCAAVHALSYPVGGSYHVPHGKANYMLFEAVYVAYRRLGADLSPLEEVLSVVFGCPAGEVWDALFALLAKIYDNQPLGDLGADAAKCAEMAKSCFENQQRLLANNPVPFTETDIRAVYESCL